MSCVVYTSQGPGTEGSNDGFLHAVSVIVCCLSAFCVFVCVQIVFSIFVFGGLIGGIVLVDVCYVSVSVYYQ